MRILIVILLVSVIVCCKKENKDYHARFTLLNAVPNSNSFRLTVGDAVVDSAIEYGKPVYNAPAPATTSTLRWKHNGPGGADSSIFTDVPAGIDFTLLFYDSLDKKKVFLVRDKLKKTSANSRAAIRFFPLVIGAAQQNLRNDTGKILINAKSFGSFNPAGSDFTELDSVTTSLKLYNGADLLDSIPRTHIEAGMHYTVFAIGVLNDTGDKKPRLILHRNE